VIDHIHQRLPHRVKVLLLVQEMRAGFAQNHLGRA
jgi:hypothetical protein